MPADYRIHPASQLIVSRAHGIFTFAEMRAHILGMASDPAFDADFSHLLDGRDIDVLEVTSEQMVELASIGSVKPSSRRALVAGRTCVYGLFRMYQAYRTSLGDTGVRVFSSVAEGIEWLDLEDADDSLDALAYSRPPRWVAGDSRAFK